MWGGNAPTDLSLYTAFEQPQKLAATTFFRTFDVAQKPSMTDPVPSQMPPNNSGGSNTTAPESGGESSDFPGGENTASGSMERISSRPYALLLTLIYSCGIWFFY